MLGLVLAGIFFFVAALIEVPIYATAAILRASYTTFILAMRAIPLLLAILLVVFSSADAWHLYGNEAYLRFIVLTVTMVGLGVVAVFRIVADEANRDNADKTSKKAGSRLIVSKAIKEAGKDESLVAKKAKVLTQNDIEPYDITQFGNIWTRWLTINGQTLLRFTIIMQVIAVAFWVSVSFIILGIVVINSKAYDQLLPTQTQPIVIWHFDVLGQTFIVSQQLVLLSVTLGTIAGLTFATQSLQDDSSRERFFGYSMFDLKCSLTTLSYYLGAFAELVVLLQLNDRSRIMAILRGELSIDQIAPKGIDSQSRIESDNASRQSSEEDRPG